MIESQVYYKMCPECENERDEGAWKAHGESACQKDAQRLRSYLAAKRDGEIASLFPAPLRSWNRHCPRHQAKLEGDVATIAVNRFIPVEWFDVFDDRGNHLCRACGARLLTKKGKPNPRLRWCHAPGDGHYKLVLETLFDFASRRLWYIHDLQARQAPEMQAKHAGEIAAGRLVLCHHDGDPERPFYRWLGDPAIACEKCGQLAIAGIGGYGRPGSQVHHKNPVCHVTTETVMSIFDPANFVALCSACHGGSHPWRKRPAPPVVKVPSLDDFLNRAPE